MTEFHKDASAELQQLREKYHDERFHQLNGQLTSASGITWSYLLAVNGGGAAGMLAFIGAKDAIAIQVWPYATLSLFVAGLLCVGFAHALIVHKVRVLLSSWSYTMVRYWRNEVRWSFLMERDQEIVERWERAPWVLGLLALMCFITGVTVTAWNFHRLASGT